MTSDWSGSSTWSSLGDGIQVGTEAHATADLVVAKTTAGAGNFDVTASLTAWLSGATTSDEANLANKGWAFLANGTDSWDFSSFEGAGQPVLTVSYTVSGGSEAMMANSLSAKSAEVVENGGTSVGGAGCQVGMRMGTGMARGLAFTTVGICFWGNGGSARCSPALDQRPELTAPTCNAIARRRKCDDPC